MNTLEQFDFDRFAGGSALPAPFTLGRRAGLIPVAGFVSQRDSFLRIVAGKDPRLPDSISTRRGEAASLTNQRKGFHSMVINDPQLPPHSSFEERLALAAIFWGNSKESSDMISQLSPTLFYEVRHQELARALKCIAATGEAVNSTSVYRWLIKHNQIKEVGGKEYIGTLPDAAISADQFGPALAELKSLALRRAIIMDCSILGELAKDITKSDSVLEDAARRLGKAYVESIGVGRPCKYLSSSLSELPQPVENDPNELIKTRFLSRGGGMLLTGPTGVGKSALTMQMAVCWALGLKTLGFNPTRPLKSLIIQAENDPADMRALRDGVYRGLEFTTDQQALVGNNVHVKSVDDICGVEFIREALDPMVEAFQPDVVWIDPLLAYLGGDASSQEVTSHWLRNTLNPVLHARNCACVLVHHIAKMGRGKDKAEWKGSDLAYLGLGSVELSNWPRAIVALISKTEDVYELYLAKRGQQADWRNPDGSRAYSRMISHGQDSIYWKEATTEELSQIPGRRQKHTVEMILELLGRDSLSASAWQKRCYEEAGISRTVFYELKKDAIATRKIGQSVSDEKWFVITS